MFPCSLVFTLTLTIFSTVHVTRCQENKRSWTTPLIMLLESRLSIVSNMVTLKRQSFQDLNNQKIFIQCLENLQERIPDFQSAPWDYRETKTEGYLQSLAAVLGIAERANQKKYPELIKNEKLSKYYQRGIAKLIHKMKRRINAFLDSTGGPSDRYKLPLNKICPTEKSSYELEKDISIIDVCTNIQKCSPLQASYHRRSSTDSTACTADNKCELEKALPKMVGFYWHALNDFILKRLCHEQCLLVLGEKGCGYFETYDRLLEELKLLIGYTSTLPTYFNDAWNGKFFKEAARDSAFSDLGAALSLIQAKKTDFSRAQIMCYKIKFTEACPYADIYTEFTFVEKLQQHRIKPALVKDLRLFPKEDNKKIVQLLHETLRDFKLFERIKQLNENLKTSVSGISTYFSSIAIYDEEIANADISFIVGELEKYEKATGDVEKKLKDNFTLAMGLMEGVALANFAEQTGLLVARIIENCNPLRVIFGGSEPGDIIEASGAAANAASKLVKASTLFITLQALVTDSLEITKAFVGENSNKAQLTRLKSLVDRIRRNQDIEADSEKFVNDYAAYTPQTDRSRLAQNNAMWSAYKDATCEILNGDTAILGSFIQSAEGVMRVCEKLEGTLAQFFTLREEIFDFQFQLVDAMAKVVRGNIAKRLSRSIKGKRDFLEAKHLMTGFLMAQIRLQTHASLYCDKLEYKQLGKPVKACSTVNGLFNTENIHKLLSYTDHSLFNQVDRDVYIPTKPSSPGDTGYIDLNSLSKGKSVLFKLPAEDEWLQNYRWTLKQETSVPFVESFKIFLPHKHYKKGAKLEHTTSRVTIRSVSGSAVSTVAPNTSPVYILPRAHSSYVTVYEEGYSSCTSTEIDNPYSLCNNLPKICVKSRRQSGESLLPTILSTWSLKYQISKGAETLAWDAPTPATNLLIRAKLKIRMLPSERKRRHLPRSSRDVVTSTNGCCNGNRYRSSLNDRNCQVCPAHSTSMSQGLYCEIDEEAA